MTVPENKIINNADALRHRTILLFGAPGAGKGTIGKALGAIPGFLHCACGDVFRNLDLATPLGRVFLEHSSRGLLVPDDTTIGLWKEAIDGQVATHRFTPDRDVLVLDGIPRNETQARILDDYIQVDHVFHLVCSDERLMFERLKRRALKENRLDDANDAVIRRRQEVYEEETQPILAHYTAENVRFVDATRSPVAVLHEILGALVAESSSTIAPSASLPILQEERPEFARPAAQGNRMKV